MSDVDPKILASQLRPSVGGVPTDPGPFRIGQISAVHAGSSPPLARVNVVDGGVLMRLAGNPWDYHPGDTVLCVNINGMSIVLQRLPMVGDETDPTSDNFTPWREVGAAGEPTFENSWVNFAGVDDYDTAAFWQQSDGWVRLKGLVKDGTATAGTTIFTLPSGLRPEIGPALYFSVISNGTAAVVEVNGFGQVRCHSNCNTAYLSLNGIAFPARITTPGVINFGLGLDEAFEFNRGAQLLPNLTVGWSQGTADPEYISFFLRGDGWVWVRGTLQVPANGLAMTVPERCSPGHFGLVLPCRGATGVGRHDVGGNSTARTPLTYRVEAGGAGQHYLGGLNWLGWSSRRTSSDALPAELPTLINGWTQFGTDLLGVRYWKDSFGVVHLMGVAQGSASTGDVVFTLPAEYRPLKRQIFNGLWGNLQGRVDVHTNGNVEALGHPNNTWLTLNGVSFRAMQ